MSAPRILIAGIGNIFLGDDAFGVEVVQRLAQRALPDAARVIDFGIRGIDLIYALLEGYDAVILVDAAPRGGQPGSLYVIEPEMPEAADEQSPTPLIDMHDLDPVKVLRLARSMGAQLDRVLLVGCEPLTTGDDEQVPRGLSGPVAAAVEEAVELIESLVAQLLRQQADAGNETTVNELDKLQTQRS